MPVLTPLFHLKAALTTLLTLVLSIDITPNDRATSHHRLSQGQNSILVLLLANRAPFNSVKLMSGLLTISLSKPSTISIFSAYFKRPGLPT